MDRFYISRNEEWFNEGPFDTREEAIAEGVAQYDGDHFYIGKRKDYQPFARDWVEEFTELETSDVYDECGSDAADNWPPKIPALERAAANEKINAILRELVGEPSVFMVVDSEEYHPADAPE